MPAAHIGRIGLSSVICHHSADRFAVRKLKAAVEQDAAKLRTHAWSDEDIETGKRWLEFFAQEVQKSHVVIFLVSKGLLNSKFLKAACMRVLAKARKRGARLIAVATDKACDLESVEAFQDFEKYSLPDNALNFGSESDVDAKYAGFASYVVRTARQVLSGNNFFISHASEDRIIADLTRARLRESGLGVWLETEELRAGQIYSEKIKASIIDCVSLLVIVTPQAIDSHWVSYECGMATGAGRKLVPLVFEEVESERGIWLQLKTYQHLNFTNAASQPWSQLIARLDEIRQESK